jgi:hypothetical protein
MKEERKPCHCITAQKNEGRDRWWPKSFKEESKASVAHFEENNGHFEVFFLSPLTHINAIFM